MLAAALLALSLNQGAAASPSKLDQLAQPAAEAPPAQVAESKAVSVVLDCQIAAKALTDCKAVNDAVDAAVLAEAIRLAAGVPVPEALADSGARIRIRMNVAP
jgi:methylmalonyl-CoA mutase cobalamin-binding subunit